MLQGSWVGAILLDKVVRPAPATRDVTWSNHSRAIHAVPRSAVVRGSEVDLRSRSRSWGPSVLPSSAGAVDRRQPADPPPPTPVTPISAVTCSPPTTGTITPR
jgi:hypothetical protein